MSERRFLRLLGVYGGLLALVAGLTQAMDGPAALLTGVGLVCYVHGTVRGYTDGDTP
jgi:hypothetical protein